MSDNVKMRIRALLVVGMAVTGVVVIWSIPPLFSQQETVQLWQIGVSSCAFLIFGAGAMYLRLSEPDTDDG